MEKARERSRFYRQIDKNFTHTYKVNMQRNTEKKKMEIRVKCRCGEDECSEWVIIELQGVVETQSSFEGSIQNLEIGHLCHSDSSQGTYTFTVGYHELVGSKVTLKKPLLVLKKLQLEEVSGNATELEVVGIIRTKILFKTRPKPLISGTN